MPVGGSKFELEKTWRSTGVGTQTFNSPGTFTMNYGRQNVYVQGKGGSGSGGTAATYSTSPGTAATYNPTTAASYNVTPGTAASYNATTAATYNVTPGTAATYSAGTAATYNTIPGNQNYNAPTYPVANYNTTYVVSGYNTVPGTSYYNPTQNLYYYQSTEVGSSYVYVNYSPFPSLVNSPDLAPYTQYFPVQYYADHQAGVLYPYAPWPQYFTGTYTDYNSYNQQTGYVTVVFQVDRPFQYNVPGNQAYNPPAYPANYTAVYPVGNYNTVAGTGTGTYNPPSYPVASYNPPSVASYNPPTYPVATYNPTSVASYNPPTYPVATYNPTSAASYNPPTYATATYNPWVAGNPSSALGVTMPGGAGGGSYVAPVGPTEISYYSYPDNASYPVTVASGGQVIIKTN